MRMTINQMMIWLMVFLVRMLLVYDPENPPMEVGTMYPSMEEFRVALKHHEIMGQFEWATEKSCTTRHIAYCVAPGCPWAIVARLTRDEKSVRVCAVLFLFS